MRKILYLHIGHYKTGTSALQAFLTDNQRKLMRRGLDYADPPLSRGRPGGARGGSGTPMCEFRHVDDMAEASLFVLDLDKATYEANTAPMLSHINVSTGRDISILDLARQVARVTGYTGRITTDPSKPDGTLRKLMNVGRLAGMGWQAKIGLEDGLEDTYRWFLEHKGDFEADPQDRIADDFRHSSPSSLWRVGHPALAAQPQVLPEAIHPVDR